MAWAQFAGTRTTSPASCTKVQASVASSVLRRNRSITRRVDGVLVVMYATFQREGNFDTAAAPGARVAHRIDGLARLLEPPALAAVEQGVQSVFVIMKRRASTRGTHVDLDHVLRISSMQPPRDAVTRGVQCWCWTQYIQESRHQTGIAYERVGGVTGVKYVIGEIRDVVGPAAALACRTG